MLVETYTTIDDLIQSSLESEDKYLGLEWIPYEKITNIKPTHIDNVHYAIYKRTDDEMPITLVFLGNSGECTQTLVSEFARIYSLPHKHDSNSDNFKRYSTCGAESILRITMVKAFISNHVIVVIILGKSFYQVVAITKPSIVSYELINVIVVLVCCWK